METLMARRDEIKGFAVVSDEEIQACVLYLKDEIVALRTLVPDEAFSLGQLLSELQVTARLPKAHPAEIGPHLLKTLGFRPTGAHRLYATTARPA